MKLKFLVSCFRAALAGVSRPGAGTGRDPVVARDGRPARRIGQRARQEVQREPEGLQGRADLQGHYDESLTAAIAAYRAGNAPHILQVFEVGTATMMAAQGRDRAGLQVMEDAGEKFDPKPTCRRSPATTPRQRADAAVLPFNSSTTVFYYNKDAFKDAASTRQAADDLARGDAGGAKLRPAAAPAPFTTVWQGWTQLESFSAWHNVPIRDQENGFGGMDARLVFNGAAAGARTSRTWPTWPSRACSSTRAAATSRRRIHLRRVRDVESTVQRLVRRTEQGTPSSRSASRPCPTTPTCPARRRTRSSAARACG